MKHRILTAAAAGVLALGLSACQKKEETPVAEATAAMPPAESDAAPTDGGAMATTPPPAEPEKK